MKNHKARKHFGQHFLKDPQVIEFIINILNLKPDDKMIEIGPGLGAITKPLLTKLQHLTVIEIDRDLQNYLQQLPEAHAQKLTVICKDVLNINWEEFNSGFRVVGNLPYNISTPLLINLIQNSNRTLDMLFMLQKEVALRLAAQPYSKAYGRLSVMVQALCNVSYLLDVPPTAFDPPPKVDSAIVRLTPLNHAYSADFFQVLEWIVAKSFAMRRKTLWNNLKTWLSMEDIESFGLDPKSRAEEVSVSSYVRIAQSMEKEVLCFIRRNKEISPLR